MSIVKYARTLAAATALAGAGVSLAIAAPVAAQEQEAPKNSKEYAKDAGAIIASVTAFQQQILPLIQQAQSATDDATRTQVRQQMAAQVPASLKTDVMKLGSLARNGADKMNAGDNMVLVGSWALDPALQIAGNRLRIDSGLYSGSELGRLHWNIGVNAFETEQFQVAQNAFAAAATNGYEPDGAVGNLILAYRRANMIDEGLQASYDLIVAQRAAGAAISEKTIRSGLQTALENDRFLATVRFSNLLADAYPTDETRKFRAQLPGQVAGNLTPDELVQIAPSIFVADADPFVVNALVNGLDRGGNVEPGEMLDRLRLLRLANALVVQQDYEQYLFALEKSTLANETISVADLATGSGVVAGDAAFIRSARASSNSYVASERRDAQAALSKTSSLDGRAAQGWGDVFLGLESWSDAQSMYQAALAKSGVDRNVVLTRLGIAQTNAGDYAAAIDTLSQVSGDRAALAGLWSAYANYRMTAM